MSRSWKIIGVAGALALLLAAVVIAGSGGSSTGTPPAADDAAVSAETMPAVSLTTLEGKPVELPSGRPGALFFTVSSCLSCIPSAQALGELDATLGRQADIVWVGIDPNDPPSAVRERRRSMGNPAYPFAIDTSGTLAGRYGVTALGTTVVFDANGRIVERLIEPGRGQLEAAFRKAGLSA